MVIEQSSEEPVPERDMHVACLKKKHAYNINTYIYMYGNGSMPQCSHPSPPKAQRGGAECD